MKKTPVSSARVIALSQKHMTIRGMSDGELLQCSAGRQIVALRPVIIA